MGSTSRSVKGILLAGGNASRLRPITLWTSKQLLPVYDKPAIYYPLTTLILAGVIDLLIISTTLDIDSIKRLLGNGEQWGIKISYAVQEAPNGIAEAYLIAEKFLADQPSILILGDNLFHGSGLGRQLSNLETTSGAKVNIYPVSDPSNFGVIQLGPKGEILSIEEKPAIPKSNFAMTGLYAFDATAPDRVKNLKPSMRGELEITDLISSYFQDVLLAIEVLPRATAWLDFGTPESLLEAAEFVRTLQNRQGILIGSPDEAAWQLNLITKERLEQNAFASAPSAYSKNILNISNQKSNYNND